jgi:hypothetical protein
MADARNARAEAAARLADPGVEVRVLEPSPPADTSDPAYLADDPAVPDAGVATVTPTTAGDQTWDARSVDDPDLAAWVADRWLGAWRRLPPLPVGWVPTRLALHRLAVYVVSPARMDAIGKMALRPTWHGFGTPFFADDRQVRVDLHELEVVDQRGDRAEGWPLSSVQAAADAVGVALDAGKADHFDIPALGDPEAPLEVDPDTARVLADWFGFAASVLEQFRSEIPPSCEPSRVQLWPEHFDPAFEAGDDAVGKRAGYGASPGDHHEGADPEPYLYVSVWAREGIGGDPFWNAPFGAKLPFAELVGADDQREAALAFLRGARAHLEAR